MLMMNPNAMRAKARMSHWSVVARTLSVSSMLCWRNGFECSCSWGGGVKKERQKEGKRWGVVRVEGRGVRGRKVRVKGEGIRRDPKGSKRRG